MPAEQTMESIVTSRAFISTAAFRSVALSQKSAEIKVTWIFGSVVLICSMTGSILDLLRPTRMTCLGLAEARAVATSAPREFLLGPVMRTCLVRLREILRKIGLGNYMSFQQHRLQER